MGPPASAEVAGVGPQAVGRVAFEVVPDLFGRMERWAIRWALFQRQTGVGWLEGSKGRPLGNRAAVPEEDDMAAQVPPERPPEGDHVHRLEGVGQPAQVQPQGVALGGSREGGPGGEPVVFGAVREARRVAGGSPGAAACGDEQKTALLQEGERRTQTLGFVFSRATGTASRARWPVRRAGGRAVPAPDSSSPRPAGSSRRVRGESAPPSGPA
jgi:hypothetical protein